MATHDTAALKQQIRSHLRIFGVLAAIITCNVAVAFSPLGSTARMAIHLGLALICATLVLTVFMHLLTEKATTLVLLAGTFVLFAVLMILTLAARHDHPDLTEYTASPTAAPVGAHHVP